MIHTLYLQLVLWWIVNFRTDYRKRKFGEKPGAFDLVNANAYVFKYMHEL